MSSLQKAVSSGIVTIVVTACMAMGEEASDGKLAMLELRSRGAGVWGRKAASTVVVRIRGNPRAELQIKPWLVLRPDAAREARSVWWEEHSGYFAPFDVTTGGPNDVNAWYRLAANASKDLRLDAKKLRWDRRLSAFWPSRSLYEVAKPGCYLLVAQVRNGSTVMESNAIEVVLR
jgi:hypothetical protein